MLKYVVLFAVVLCSVHSQRPWHAGSSGRLPQVLPQYLDEQAAAAQAAQANLGVQNAQAVAGIQGVQGVQTIPDVQGTLATVANRIDGETIASPAVSTIAPPITAIPFDLPVDAHGDIDLINRIKTWPREQQPFWYLNWQAIQAHRGDMSNVNDQQQQQIQQQQQQQQQIQLQPSPRSFFAG